MKSEMVYGWELFSCTNKFLQLYMIHGLRHGRNIVGTYTLLANKTLCGNAE